MSTVFTSFQIVAERRGQLIAESGSFMLGGAVGSWDSIIISAMMRGVCVPNLRRECASLSLTYRSHTLQF